MDTEELLKTLSIAAGLKTVMRHCWTAENRQESVAEHSWRLALMAMLLSSEEEFRNLDMHRVIRMCLIHDLGEAFTGDIPVFEKTSQDANREDEIFLEWVEKFPESRRTEWLRLLDEMEKQETQESRTYKALDKLEAVISHNESDISTWLPLEYDLQLKHGQENVRFSPGLTELKEQIDAWTRRKIAESGMKELQER